jgi:succinate dehydrogenase / fumarate reductase cytochrome b subunit
MTSEAPSAESQTPRSVIRSTIGQKAVMALTGMVLLGYIVLHMLGNLKIFTGRAHFDAYAEALRAVGGDLLGESWFLWIMRPVLLVAVLLHIWSATALTVRSSQARPVAYAGPVRRVQATYASRTMRWGGVIILLFIVYHLLHMTTGTLHNDFEHGAVYDNSVAAFKQWWVSAAYIVAVGALGMHLYHGLWSMFQTLGRNSPRWHGVLRRFAQAGAVAITVGFVAVPVGVMTGIVH